MIHLFVIFTPGIGTKMIYIYIYIYTLIRNYFTPGCTFTLQYITNNSCRAALIGVHHLIYS